MKADIHERIAANTIAFADMLQAFQQELLGTFDTIRNKENAYLLERIAQVESGVTALAGTVAELLIEMRRFSGEFRAYTAGIAVERGEAEAHNDAGR